jgi:enoyl-CoA hydratase
MITVEDGGGIALLRMDDGKANAIQDRFLARLNRALDDAAGAPAIVLTGARRIFSAGLDLPVLSSFSRGAMADLMRDFHATMLRLFLWPAPVVCAVNGHAYAGGCVLAMQGDRRIMADGEGKIGINEVRLGLPLPAIVVETFRARLAPGALASAALEGRLYAPREAAEAGLVDEVVSAEALEGRAVEAAYGLAEGGAAFGAIKGMLRRPAAEALERQSEEDARRWLDGWFSENGRRRIAEAVARLQRAKP